jgi:DNA-binding response OmpR family regulator
MKPRRIAVLGADATTLALLREWLPAPGWELRTEQPPARAASAPAAARDCDLVIVDVPWPRAWRGLGPAGSLDGAHAEAPVLALSATVHASVDPTGAVARSLGVAAVLPKPLRRETLVDAVQRLMRTPSA